jgi:hypothetical protein
MLTIIKIWILVNMLAFALMFPARAQQPTPAQTALQIDNVINQWAQTIEALQRENADLKKQIEDAKAAKLEEKK